MDLNVFDNNSGHILRLRNNGGNEPEIEKVGDKFEFILRNNISNAIRKITDFIQEFNPPIPGYLYNVTWMHCKNLPLLKEIIPM